MNAKDYEAAMAEIDALLDKDPDPDTADGQRIGRLVKAIQRYEKRHQPFMGHLYYWRGKIGYWLHGKSKA